MQQLKRTTGDKQDLDRNVDEQQCVLHTVITLSLPLSDYITDAILAHKSFPSQVS